MGAVFEATGFDGPRAAVAADELRRGRRPLRHRPARHALRPRDPRRLRARARLASSRSSRACSAGGGVVRAINAGAREMSRSELDGLNEVVQIHGAKAVAPIYAGDGGWTGNLAKFFTRRADRGRQRRRSEASDGDLLLFVADAAGRRGGLARRPAARARAPLRADPGGPARRRSGSSTSRCSSATRRPGAGRRCTIRSRRPSGDLSDPGALRSRAYDLVLDGVEIGGGSIRIHTPEVQSAVFEHIGLDADEAQERFGFLLDALRFGAPPHGGIAMGIDRIVALDLRPGVDPRRDRVPEDRQRRRPAHRARRRRSTSASCASSRCARSWSGPGAG